VADDDFTSWPDVEISGHPLTGTVVERLAGIVVDHHEQLPAMFLLRLRGEVDILKTARIEIGSDVEIKAHGLGSTSSMSLISGEVTSIEADYSALSAETLVRGYDRSHRLQSRRRAQTYPNKKISDLVRNIAQEAGLGGGTIDDSGETLDLVSQHNLTDWEFVRAQARELGFDVTVTHGKLNFRSPTTASTGPDKGSGSESNPRQMVFGENLLEFRPRLSAVQQVPEVTVHGWNPKEKQAVTGTASAQTHHAEVGTKPASLAKTFTGQTFVAHGRPLATQKQAEKAAHSIAEQIASTFLEAEGVALGSPELLAGVAVNISGVAEQFAGRYVLARTRHVFDDDGYRTHFVISGRQDRTLLGLVSLGASNGQASGGGPAVHGTVVGIVTQNDDPDKAGRVKLRFPWLPDTYESDWTRVVQLGAGPNSGAVFLPEVNDEVLCAFEFGDVRRPYVIGGLHNGKAKPKLGEGLVDAGKVTRRGFVSRAGHRIIMLDGGSKSGIALISADGKLRVSLNQTKGEVHVHSDGPVTIDAGTGKVSITAGGDMALEAKGNLSLKGNAGVKIESSAMVEVSGKLIKLN